MEAKDVEIKELFEIIQTYKNKKHKKKKKPSIVPDLIDFDR